MIISQSEPEQLFELKTFPSQSRIIHVQPINVIDAIEVDDRSMTLKNQDNISIVESLKSMHDPKDNANHKKPTLFELRKSSIMSFNNFRKNKNLISFTGMFLLGINFSLILYLVFGSRQCWLSIDNAEIWVFVTFCCIPVILPTVYFMRNPKHLIRVLNDLFL